MLRIIFLGTGGSLPTRNRNPSSIMINREGELILFDCGEGTQQQMMRAKTGLMNLSSIFISHFHGEKRTSYDIWPRRNPGIYRAS